MIEFEPAIGTTTFRVYKHDEVVGFLWLRESGYECEISDHDLLYTSSDLRTIAAKLDELNGVKDARVT